MRAHTLKYAHIHKFTKCYTGKVDTDFWNRIACIRGGGSFPLRLEGWVLAFVGFNDKGDYVLNDLEHIKKSNKYGEIVSTIFQ